MFHQNKKLIAIYDNDNDDENDNDDDDYYNRKVLNE